VTQAGASVGLVNEAHGAEVAALASGSTLAETLARMDAIGIARERLAGNVAPLLALEAMAIALRPERARLG